MSGPAGMTSPEDAALARRALEELERRRAGDPTVLPDGRRLTVSESGRVIGVDGSPGASAPEFIRGPDGSWMINPDGPMAERLPDTPEDKLEQPPPPPVGRAEAQIPQQTGNPFVDGFNAFRAVPPRTGEPTTRQTFAEGERRRAFGERSRVVRDSATGELRFAAPSARPEGVYGERGTYAPARFEDTALYQQVARGPLRPTLGQQATRGADDPSRQGDQWNQDPELLALAGRTVPEGAEDARRAQEAREAQALIEEQRRERAAAAQSVRRRAARARAQERAELDRAYARNPEDEAFMRWLATRQRGGGT